MGRQRHGGLFRRWRAKSGFASVVGKPEFSAGGDGDAGQAGSPAKPSKLVVGALELDPRAHRANVNGEKVRLTALQMRLLIHLCARRDEVVSRADLLREVWGYASDLETRTVDIQVHRLRSRLGAARVLITTVRGVGYRLSEDPE